MEVFQALEHLGHQTFRPGQEQVIMRILSGEHSCGGLGGVSWAKCRPKGCLTDLCLLRYLHIAGAAHRRWQVPVLPAPRTAVRPTQLLPYTGCLSAPVAHG